MFVSFHVQSTKIVPTVCLKQSIQNIPLRSFDIHFNKLKRLAKALYQLEKVYNLDFSVLMNISSDISKSHCRSH